MYRLFPTGICHLFHTPLSDSPSGLKVDLLAVGAQLAILHRGGLPPGISGHREGGQDVADPYCNPQQPVEISFTQISSAYYGIKNGVHHSDCRFSDHFSKEFGADVHLKMELNQAASEASSVSDHGQLQGARSSLGPPQYG